MNGVLAHAKRGDSSKAGKYNGKDDNDSYDNNEGDDEEDCDDNGKGNGDKKYKPSKGY